MPELIGNTAVLRSLRPQEFTDERFGLPTVTDILKELQKPGRDPRPAFTTASFAEGVETLADVTPGMVLEGVVTNVAAFGAFVDLGGGIQGLLHVSDMGWSRVTTPSEIVAPGDQITVKVLRVDDTTQKPQNSVSVPWNIFYEDRPVRGAQPRLGPIPLLLRGRQLG